MKLYFKESNAIFFIFSSSKKKVYRFSTYILNLCLYFFCFTVEDNSMLFDDNDQFDDFDSSSSQNNKNPMEAVAKGM